MKKIILSIAMVAFLAGVSSCTCCQKKAECAEECNCECCEKCDSCDCCEKCDSTKCAECENCECCHETEAAQE